ncbi:energy transducer TonB [Novosphingobium sp.]|uniref:energy transducer TonB n=1 Tax=Novosphingobium sp. TaxID=1874826 RepID=UPI00286D979D|nr:energy transducer TonB [Novosphingobium sp.]
MVSTILFTLVMAVAPTTTGSVPVEVAKPLPLCQAWGPKPPACIEPPLRETVSIYNSWRQPDGSHPAEAVMIRPPSLLNRDAPPAGIDQFPAWLRSGEARRSAEVTLNLVIAADGTIVSCKAARVDAYEHAEQFKRTKISADSALGDQACTMVRASRKFRPAIDAEGKRIEAPMAVAVYYKRERYDMLAPPAPPPPSRYLGTVRWGDTKAWPPRYYLDAPVSFAAPKFKDFLTDTKNLPQKAMVGVVMDLANTGQAVRCDVRVPSGDKQLDDSTCAALLTVNATPNRWGVRGLPVEVTWQGSKAKALLAGPQTLPNLAATVVIPPEQRPASPPRWGMRVLVVLDPQGKPTSCTVSGTSDDDALDAASCKLARQARYTPGKDGFGRPAPGGVDLRIDWARGEIVPPAY